MLSEEAPVQTQLVIYGNVVATDTIDVTLWH